MSSTIDQRPPGSGPDDATGRFPVVPGPPVPHGPAFGPAGPGYRPGGARPMYPFPAQIPTPPGWPTPVPPDGRTRTVRRWLVAPAVGVVVLILVIASAAANSTMTVNGTLTLKVDYSSVTPGTSCDGAGYYSWLDPGSTPVTIYDASGKVVGTTTLGYGTAYSSGNGWSSSYADSCVFDFTLTDIPAGDDFYRVKAGSNAGDGVTFTADQLRSGGAQLVVDGTS